jgi:hypothetical protein
MKKLLILLLISATTMPLLAQKRDGEPNKKERIHAMRVAFLTERLELTSKEAEVFWPVYNELRAEMKKNRSAHKQHQRSTRDAMATLTEAQTDAAIAKEIQLREQELEIRKRYTKRLREVLPAKKVLKLYVVEEEFKRELMGRVKGGPPPAEPGELED